MPMERSGSCQGKEAFASAKLAHHVLRRGKNTHAPQDVYRCRYCGFYHIGSALRRVSPDRKRDERLRYSTIANTISAATASDFDDLS